MAAPRRRIRVLRRRTGRGRSTRVSRLQVLDRELGPGALRPVAHDAQSHPVAVLPGGAARRCLAATSRCRSPPPRRTLSPFPPSRERTTSTRSRARMLQRIGERFLDDAVDLRGAVGIREAKSGMRAELAPGRNSSAAPRRPALRRRRTSPCSASPAGYSPRAICFARAMDSARRAPIWSSGAAAAGSAALMPGPTARRRAWRCPRGAG